MNVPKLVFFGSFLQYSAEILHALIAAHQAGDIVLLGVVTTPPQPAGRKQELKKTDVHQVAEAAGLTVFHPPELTDASLADITQAFGTPELIVTAGYGKLLPPTWLSWPTIAALNLHFSLLPKYRGANPAEWALLMGENVTGVTLIEMSPEFDTGKMVAQAQQALSPTDTRETVYAKLYSLGAKTLVPMIKGYLVPSSAAATAAEISFFTPPITQPPSPTPYAKRFQRDDGFVQWSAIQEMMAGNQADPSLASPLLQTILAASLQPFDARFIASATRALAGFPSVWTKVMTAKGEKRLKIHSAAVSINSGRPQLTLETVQLEGQSPATWNQIKNSLV